MRSNMLLEDDLPGYRRLSRCDEQMPLPDHAQIDCSSGTRPAWEPSSAVATPYWHWDPRFLAQGQTEVPAPDHQASFEAALAGIRVPTLLVRGLLSDVVTDEGVKDFLENE